MDSLDGMGAVDLDDVPPLAVGEVRMVTGGPMRGEGQGRTGGSADCQAATDQYCWPGVPRVVRVKVASAVTIDVSPLSYGWRNQTISR